MPLCVRCGKPTLWRFCNDCSKAIKKLTNQPKLSQRATDQPALKPTLAGAKTREEQFRALSISD